MYEQELLRRIEALEKRVAELDGQGQAQPAGTALVVIDYGEVNVSRLIVTNDRREYESWQKRGKVEVLFEPRVMTESGAEPVSLFIVGIQQDVSGAPMATEPDVRDQARSHGKKCMPRVVTAGSAFYEGFTAAARELGGRK